MGGHASDWSLTIHSNAFGQSLAWSLVYLFDILVHQVRGSWESCSWKVKQLLAIHFVLGKVSRLFN